jgi:hypothetical protein
MSKRKYYSLLITLPACAEGRQVKLGAKWLLDLIFILSPYEYWLHFMQRSPIIKLISLYRNSPQKKRRMAAQRHAATTIYVAGGLRSNNPHTHQLKHLPPVPLP